MPTVAVVAGMTILIYYDDHDPPHFHVRAANFRAKVAIHDLSVVEVVGRMKASEIRTIQSWARRHQPASWDNWLRASQLEAIRKIED